MNKDFTEQRFILDGVEIKFTTGGKGPPLLLLHGYPETRATWNRVAPALAGRFTIVAPDLRGYGDGTVPPGADFSKRAMALDQVNLMTSLGYERFSVVGHDRGGRVAYRLALDHPGRVDRLAVLDMVPTLDMWEMMDASMAMANYHWLFLAQPGGLPENLLGRDPDGYLDHTVLGWCGTPGALDPVVAEYRRCFRRPEVIAAACGDYRAGAGIDRTHDAEDRAAGRRIGCPVLALWAGGGTDGLSHDTLEIWRRWADDVSGHAIPCGHFLQEEAPDEVARALIAFFD
ncbi:fluoroacetate dehalogenase [Skermanella stibiiresistens SB22]|uniref:Fluoroacetate dehalogenase n=1 Tax=Skermanella stibiiresistens SB22 TaxID=1385369 RepID=W9H0F4_9PROT|nr:alpha/beta hydrolase [Skermanella stibiiresistens]EWY38177.1 fluoroacetate dehalogenase [Skermanella stibiiresistens SB22]